MRVFVPFEVSGKVRQAFRLKGHDAWSCDLEEPDDDSNYHYQGDYRKFVRMGWDMMIAFPVCTCTSVSGNRWYAGTQEREQGLQNFIDVWNVRIKKKCLEHPISIVSTRFRKWNQIIHPWEHGHKEMKPTCLYLDNLPLIKPTNMVGPPPTDPKERRKWQKIWTMGPSDTRQKDRAETYDGIAEAFGIHWG